MLPWLYDSLMNIIYPKKKKKDSLMSIIIIKFIFAFFVVEIVFNNIILSCRYDREESNTMSDVDTSSLFLGDEASFQKKEAELAQKMVCCDRL